MNSAMTCLCFVLLTFNFVGLQKLKAEPSVLEPKVTKPQPKVVEDVVEDVVVPEVKKKYMVNRKNSAVYISLPSSYTDHQLWLHRS